MDSFTLTISHLQSPIFYLATVAAGSNLRPPFSIFDLTSGADGWALGSTICILHLLSPTFWPVLLLSDLPIHNLNLRSLVLNGEPDRRDLLARLGRVRVERSPLEDTFMGVDMVVIERWLIKAVTPSQK